MIRYWFMYRSIRRNLRLYQEMHKMYASRCGNSANAHYEACSSFMYMTGLDFEEWVKGRYVLMDISFWEALPLLRDISRG